MTIAVVDDYEADQKDIASHTERFLQEHDSSPVQFYFYSSGEEFISALSPHFFDLVLLDCCMEGMDGMETAKELRRKDKEAALIFITSCKDYAVGGYLVAASGYLVKPYTYDTFSCVLNAACSQRPRKRKMITVLDGRETKRILVDDIVYCDIEGHYVQIHFSNGGRMRVRMTFGALASILAPYPQFLECYRGCLINMAHTYKAEESNFVMDTGERVPFRRKEHIRLLKEYSSYVFDKTRSE